MRFPHLLAYEVRHYGRLISTHVYFGLFFFLSTMLTLALGGAFESVNAAAGGGGGNVHADGPFSLASMMLTWNLFAIFVIAAVSGNTATRDVQVDMHALVFTTSVKKSTLLASRILGALLVNLYVVAAVPLGMLFALQFPWLEAERLGSFSLGNLLVPFFAWGLPTLLFTTSVFFGLAAVTRRMFPNYVGGVFLLVGYVGASILTADLDTRTTAALLDPFGLEAFSELTRYWTAFEKNTLTVWPTGVALVNRALWLAVGLGVLAVSVTFVRLDQEGSALLARLFGKSEVTVDEEGPAEAPSVTMPAVTRRTDLAAQLVMLRAYTVQSVRNVVANRYFPALVVAMIAFLALDATVIGSMYGTDTWPVTYQVLEVFRGDAGLFTLIILTFYAGDLVWHDRDLGLDQIVDASPVPHWIPFVARMLALAGIIYALQTVQLVMGVLAQAANGYTHFELSLYLQDLYGFWALNWLLIAMLALVVQILVNHKYLGHLVMIVYFVGQGFRTGLGWEHNLPWYGSSPGLVYSDMNGYGWYAGPYLLYKTYWVFVALFLAGIARLFVVRGTDMGLRGRLQNARQRLDRPGLLWLGATGATAAALASFIYVQTNVLRPYRTSADQVQLQVTYEREFKEAWQDKPQPRFSDVNLEVELFPRTGDGVVKGTLGMVNRTDNPIDTLFLNLNSDIDYPTLSLDVPVAEVQDYPEQGVRIWHLERPLAPGEQATLTMEARAERKGFPNSGADTTIVGNGSFVNARMALPMLGYSRDLEVASDAERRKQGLPERARMYDLDDTTHYGDTYLAQDADWVTFAATVCTDADQIALAPGYLVSDEIVGDRRCLRYAMDAPILHFYSFLSARWEVTRGDWNGLPIEVYHHPGHDWNVDRMIDATKKSLARFTEAFGPYQHRQVRILEFPRYESFAQSFPNTIPYSESIGFIARVQDPDEDIDYPFYITAHEVAHQWWAHQVIGANVQGGTVMSETMSQYAALLVMEDEYGPEHMQRFLRYELDSYLQGRAFERKKELPLMRVENQPYIHYRKGSLIMWNLRDILGEEVLNGALKSYLEQTRFQSAPYTTSREFVAAIDAVTPPEFKYVLEDSFETITLYENRTVTAKAQPTPDGRWQVTLDLDLKKYRADEEGEEHEAEMNDYIDVGVFAGTKAKPQVLHLQKHWLKSGPQTVTVTVDQQPTRAGVDPYNKLIDRNPGDNEAKVVLDAS